MEEQQILNKLNGQYCINHCYCEEHWKLINDVNEKKSKFSKSFLDAILKSQRKTLICHTNLSHQGYHKTPIDPNIFGKLIMPTLDKLLDRYDVNYNLTNYCDLIYRTNDDICIGYIFAILKLICKKKKFTLSLDNFKNVGYSVASKHWRSLIEIIPPTKKLSHLLCKLSIFDHIDTFAQQYKILPCDKCLAYAIMRNYNKDKDIDYIIKKYGVLYGIHSLHMACSVLNIPRIEEILQSGVQPTNKCIFKHIPIKGTVNHIFKQEDFDKLLELMANYKYSFTKDDIIGILRSSNFTITNINKLGVPLDDEISKVCIETNKFIYEELFTSDNLKRIILENNVSQATLSLFFEKGIFPDKETLQNFCAMDCKKGASLSLISSFCYMVKKLKKYKLFDEICLYNACKAENTFMVVELVAFIKPTDKCFDTLTGLYTKDKVLAEYNEIQSIIKNKKDRARELREEKKKKQRIKINK